MRRFQAVALACLALPLVTQAQGPLIRPRYSSPSTPSNEVLRRLGMRLAWQATVPMDGRKDGFARILIDNEDLLVLTRSGMLARINAETGKFYWKTRVGRPYTTTPTISANFRSVFVVMNAEASSIERERGTQEWRMDLPTGLSAAPVVGEVVVEKVTEDVYFFPGANNHLSAYVLPPPEEYLAGLSARDRRDLGKPRRLWSAESNLELTFQPLRTASILFAISPSGKGRAFNTRNGEEAYRFEAFGKVHSRPGQHGDDAYIGSDDGNVYALSLLAGKLRWRHTAGSSIRNTPAALDTDVFVTSDREGMARLDAETGDSKWKVAIKGRVSSTNPDADLFLAASERFVYALDFSGRTVILDRKRGTTLSRVDWSAWTIPVVNMVTDRLYLAANDGTIVCLHDQELPRPIRYRKAIEDREAPIHRRLERFVTEESNREGRLEDHLKYLAKKYNFKFEFDMARLKLAKMEGVKDREVKLPRVDEKPLADLLEKLLDLVEARYDIFEGMIRILPGKPPPGAPKDKEPKDKEPKDKDRKPPDMRKGG
jgi:outer membrane protein assembly factor BamB